MKKHDEIEDSKTRKNKTTKNLKTKKERRVEFYFINISHTHIIFENFMRAIMR